MATEEANRLERLLKLEPHQTFFIDSILQHDMRAMHDEIEALRASGTQEYTVYKQVQNRWVDQIDSSYRKILTEYQQGYGKGREKSPQGPKRVRPTGYTKEPQNRGGGPYSRPRI